MPERSLQLINPPPSHANFACGPINHRRDTKTAETDLFMFIHRKQAIRVTMLSETSIYEVQHN